MKRVFWAAYSIKEIMELLPEPDIDNLFCSDMVRKQCVREWEEKNRCPNCRRVVVEIKEVGK